jgi:hypothetical protein
MLKELFGLLQGQAAQDEYFTLKIRALGSFEIWRNTEPMTQLPTQDFWFHAKHVTCFRISWPALYLELICICSLSFCLVFQKQDDVSATGSEHLLALCVCEEQNKCGSHSSYLDAFAKWRKATLALVMAFRMEELDFHWTDFDEI